MVIDHETVLNMWVRGEPTDKIAATVGVLPVVIPTVVSRYRVLGDPRAINRQRGSAFKKTASTIKSNIERFHLKKRLETLPCNPSQIAEAVRSYVGPVTVCPTGFHLGHRPEVLDYFNI